ncbi:MAG: winged helix-turn-helix domain-containing protein [Halioglobus sp.]|nr:winged helix-turn-helix domain-containing protein [Halioglobus sp.]
MYTKVICLVRRTVKIHGSTLFSTRLIEISHEELGNLLGASRQSVSKELKPLEREGDIELRYGKIFFKNLDELGEKYETTIALEQVTPGCQDDD